MQSTIEIILDSLPAERGLRVVARSLEDIGESADRQAPAFRRLSGELARIERQARPMANALRTAAEGIQRGFSDAFTTIFRDGRLRFDDLADSLKNAFARLLGEMAALAVARPIIVPVVAGIGSLLGLPGSAVAGVTSRLGGGPGISDLFGLGRALPGLFGATSVGLGGGATAASLGVSAVAGGMSNAGIATASSLAGIGSALSFALPIAGLVAPLLLGGLFAGKPSDRTASLQGMLSDGLRPSEDGADGETRALRDQLGQMVGEALAAVSRATGQRPPDDLYLDLAAGNRDGLRFWLYETAEDLFGKPASVRPEALASGRYDDPQALVAGLVEALTGAMTGTAMSLQEVLARNFADDARRMADGIPDALDQVIDRFRSLKGTAEDLAAEGLIDLDTVLADLKTVRDRDLGAALAGLDAAALQAVITYYSTVERNTPILHAAEEALRAMGQASDGLAASLGTAQRRFVDSQITAARAYLGEMEQQAAAWRQLAGSLQQTRLGLLVDPELSPLSPADRL
ncbi:MAG: hypothetical protein KJ825_01445, partial [Alphaproteobacteria bacterium]|nr:hypothetical protein [Alphaproteobacteria bacterium]